jgi:hypothetical protein
VTRAATWDERSRRRLSDSRISSPDEVADHRQSQSYGLAVGRRRTIPWGHGQRDRPCVSRRTDRRVDRRSGLRDGLDDELNLAALGGGWHKPRRLAFPPRDPGRRGACSCSERSACSGCSWSSPGWQASSRRRAGPDQPSQPHGRGCRRRGLLWLLRPPSFASVYQDGAAIGARSPVTRSRRVSGSEVPPLEGDQRERE